MKSVQKSLFPYFYSMAALPLKEAENPLCEILIWFK